MKKSVTAWVMFWPIEPNSHVFTTKKAAQLYCAKPIKVRIEVA